MKLAEYLEVYGDLLKARLSPARVTVEWSYVRNHLLRFFGDAELDSISRGRLKDFVASHKAAGYAAPSINTALSILRKILHDAVDRGVLDVMPIRGKLPRVKEKLLHNEMTVDELRAFMASFDDADAYLALKGRRTGLSDFNAMQPVFALALETGLSRSDLLTLKWDDVKPGLIEIERGKTQVHATIPLSEVANIAVTCLWQRHLRAEAAGRSVPQVCVDKDGRPYSLGTVLSAFATAKAISGIKRRLRFHDLRHTFASRLASKGVPLQIIARALGHASTKMSERYARPNDESMERVREALS